MSIKIIAFALLAACGINPNTATAESPTEQPDAPPHDDKKDQHFCCQSVDLKDLTGEGCVTIGPGQIDLCSNVLYCEGNWAKSEGKVACG